MYRGTGDQAEWDGTYKGETQPPGIYVYQLYTQPKWVPETSEANTFFKDGSITVIR